MKNAITRILETHDENLMELERAITAAGGDPKIILGHEAVRKLLRNLAQNRIDIQARYTAEEEDEDFNDTNVLDSL